MFDINTSKLHSLTLDKITFGSDPEFFIQNTETKEFIPSCGWVGGTKEKPIFIENKLGFQEDNVALEYNIPPTTNPEEFYNYVQKLHNYIKHTHNFNDKKLDIVCLASAIFEVEHLLSEQAAKFG